MVNDERARNVASVASYSLTDTFLALIRAAGTTRSSDGHIVDASGARYACSVDSTDRWNLTDDSDHRDVPISISENAFNYLRNSDDFGVRVLALVTMADGSKIAATVMLDPGSPIDPG